MKRFKVVLLIAAVISVMIMSASCSNAPEDKKNQDTAQNGTDTDNNGTEENTGSDPAAGPEGDLAGDAKDNGKDKDSGKDKDAGKDKGRNDIPDLSEFADYFPDGEVDPELWEAYQQEYLEKQKAAEEEKKEKDAAAASYVPESISDLAIEQNPKPEAKGTDASENKTVKLQLSFSGDGTFSFKQEPDFYENDIELTIEAPDGVEVYYTLDGSIPTKASPVYSEPLIFEKQTGKFPDCHMLRACTFDAAGNPSKIAARSYLTAENAKTRFTTPVFFVSGNPDELTEKPDGIFVGYNYKERGRESERMVYVEAFEADAEPILAQFAGVRIYGGASRESTIKSMKLFSRKSYDEDNRNFKIKSFGTEKLDGSGDIIKKYDKLVLRNCGNDLQFSYIRDELSQTLCKNAGMDVYEAVVPAVAYLNGSYYGLFWLHENYCDKYFKEKFGDAEGEFIVAEGNDRKKADDDDPVVQAQSDDFNKNYERFTGMDLTIDANYRQLCNFMDVENYLDYFAWNIALNNFDWPNNNVKCYRYVGNTYGEGVFDGRWRFLPHDMDFSYNLYDQNDTKPSFNTLKVVLNPNHDRHSPLFTALMSRADCRHYFREKTLEYCNGVLSKDGIISAYEELHDTRKAELDCFYEHLMRLEGKGDFSIWSRKEHYINYERQIYDFAEKRAEYAIQYMDDLLPEL